MLCEFVDVHREETIRRGRSAVLRGHDSGAVCQSITELAVETNAPVMPVDLPRLAVPALAIC